MGSFFDHPRQEFLIPFPLMNPSRVHRELIPCVEYSQIDKDPSFNKPSDCASPFKNEQCNYDSL